MIEFRLNGHDVTLEVDPAERLLDVLRYRLGLTGTKEGCAEGECGSCTVYLDGLPVDACLVPSYQVRNREVTTVEALDRAALGPFLRSGATQCGACTPGVVMTGAWLSDRPNLLETHSVRELMAGNLCRCTGYDGIVEGVEAALGERGATAVETSNGERVPASAGSAPREPTEVERATVRGQGRVLYPATLKDALEARSAEPDATPIAGATDLLVHWPQHLDAHHRTYVDLTGLDELRGHRWSEDDLTLGALTTYWDVVRDARARAKLPLLEAAARQVGAIQIQARGTWAGNIANASPAADGVPVLMAYGAEVEVQSLRGRESIPLDEFYRGYKQMALSPDQLITSIRVPLRSYDIQWFDKVGSRSAQAITKVGVAVTRRADAPTDRWRVVANSVAPTVVRCRRLEQRLETGDPIDSPTEIEEALAADVSPIDDIRSTAEYRRAVLARLLYFGLRDRVDFVS